MGDQRRWAARYQFLDQLWRGRDRIVCDDELEAALHAGVEGPTASLVDALIPAGTGRGAGDRAWVALRNDRRAASFARARGGTVFVSLADASEVASDEPWQVALVHLAVPATGASTRAELIGPLESFLEVLAERLEDDPDRTVVLSLPCADDEDQSYELLADLVEELFGDGRIYGVCRPGMAAFYDFGPVLEPADDGDEGDDSDDGGADIEVDNTLGSEAPRFEAFLAIVGAGVAGEGVTFVELPEPGPTAGPAASSGDDELAALRLQLAEAQRRGDLQAIERQALLEKLEQAEDRIATLEEQLDDAAARASGDGPTGAGAARVDALMAREQSLRWELDRARSEIERLEARPVEAVEAQLATLRAELAELRAALAEAESRAAQLADADDDDLAMLASLLDAELEQEPEPTPAQLREWERARSTVDHLLRKLERGAELSALELHRQLAALKRLL